MKKLKYILAVIICCAVVFALSPGGFVSGEDQDAELPGQAPPGEEMPLEELLAAMVTQIDALTDQVNALTLQLTAIQGALSPSGYDGELLSRQLTQSRETEIYMFRTEYMSVCLARRSGELMTRRRDLLEKQLAVEKVKLSLGESTRESADALVSQKTNVERQITLNYETWSMKKKYLDTKQGGRGYEFIQNYTIPSELPAPTVTSADELKSALLDKNATLYSYGSQIETLNDSLDEMRLTPGAAYEAADSIRSELSNLNAQYALYEKQLSWAALGKYAAYEDALARYRTYEELRPVLSERLALLDETYAAGEISELERASRQFSIYEELYSADEATVALLVAVAELDIMAKGIVTG
jgi:hypothetical protein